MLRRTLEALTRPIARALLRTVSIEDAWQRFEREVPTELYGVGAEHEFSWYLEGESKFQLSSIEEIKDWLAECTYAADPELFHEADFWQHPCTFERLRTGDCEDFALWSWRKLMDLGLETEFVAGRCKSCPGAVSSPAHEFDTDPTSKTRDSSNSSLCSDWNTGHAWVHFRENGNSFIFDALPGKDFNMVTPVEEAQLRYLPEVSVDASLRRYVYGGFYLLKNDR